MVENATCYSSVPVTVQAGLRVPGPQCSPAGEMIMLTNTNPAPAPIILVRNAGWIILKKCRPYYAITLGNVVITAISLCDYSLLVSMK